jgi:hypothetical protein
MADETDNDITDAATKIIWAGSIPADNSTPVLINSGLVISSLECIAVDYVEDVAEAYVTIIGHYENA